MAIGERDWETEFFVGSAPTRNLIIEIMSDNEGNTTLTKQQRDSLRKFDEETLRKIEQITYDHIGDKPEETPPSFLKKYLRGFLNKSESDKI